MRVSFPPQLATLVITCLVDNKVLPAVGWCLTVVSICISRTAGDGEHLFYLSAICMSFWEKNYMTSLIYGI